MIRNMLQYFRNGGEPGDDEKADLTSSKGGQKTSTLTKGTKETTEKQFETRRFLPGETGYEGRQTYIPWAEGVNMNQARDLYLRQNMDAIENEYNQYFTSVQPPAMAMPFEAFAQEKFSAFAAQPEGEAWAAQQMQSGNLTPTQGVWDGQQPGLRLSGGDLDPYSIALGRSVTGVQPNNRQADTLRRDLQRQLEYERGGAQNMLSSDETFTRNLQDRYGSDEDLMLYERKRIAESLKGEEKRAALRNLRDYREAKLKGEITPEMAIYEKTLQARHKDKSGVAARRALGDLNRSEAGQGLRRYGDEAIAGIYNLARYRDAQKRLERAAPQRTAALGRPSQNLGLLTSIGDYQQAAARGMSENERQALEEAASRASATAMNRAIQTGDSAAVAAQIQALNQGENQSALDRLMASEKLRDSRMGNLTSMLNNVQQQQNYIDQYDERRGQERLQDWRSAMASYGRARDAAQADKWGSIRDGAQTLQGLTRKIATDTEPYEYDKWFTDQAYGVNRQPPELPNPDNMRFTPPPMQDTQGPEPIVGQRTNLLTPMQTSQLQASGPPKNPVDLLPPNPTYKDIWGGEPQGTMQTRDLYGKNATDLSNPLDLLPKTLPAPSQADLWQMDRQAAPQQQFDPLPIPGQRGKMKKDGGMIRKYFYK